MLGNDLIQILLLGRADKLTLIFEFIESWTRHIYSLVMHKDPKWTWRKQSMDSRSRLISKRTYTTKTALNVPDRGLANLNFSVRPYTQNKVSTVTFCWGLLCCKELQSLNQQWNNCFDRFGFWDVSRLNIEVYMALFQPLVVKSKEE